MPPSPPTTAEPRPRYAEAIAEAFERLRRELPAHLRYHDAAHTIDDVVPAVQRLARSSGCTADEQAMLEVAAAYHDLGHARAYRGHEEIGIALMRERLPAHGFDAARLERLAGLVRATQMPQTPLNLEQQLLADADLDSLGRPDFLETSIALWHELQFLGMAGGWQDWLETQQRFLSEHRYFTPAARALREAGKRENLALLDRLLEDARAGRGAPPAPG